MSKIGLFEKLFPKTSVNQATDGYFTTLTSYRPSFTTFRGGVYEAALCRSAIHTFAVHCSKLSLEDQGASKGIGKLLNTKPNPWQTTSQFLYRLATIYECENNAFIVPMLDEVGDRILGLYPVCPSQVSILESKGEPYLKFTFPNGKSAIVELKRVGIMTKHQYKDDFFGTNDNPLYPTLQLMTTQNEGIIEGVKNSATIRFLARIANTLKPADIDAERKRFRESNLSASNSGGVIIVDGKYAEVRQIDSKPFVVDNEQMKLINENVYTYFGINDKILKNEFNEETWNAYYEGKIEPWAIMLSQVLTSMIYSGRQETFGNFIIASSNRLQYASNTTKLSIVTQLFDRGMMTTNQGLEIFNMPGVGEEGDKRYIRKEYAEVDKLNESQGLEVTE